MNLDRCRLGPAAASIALPGGRLIRVAQRNCALESFLNSWWDGERRRERKNRRAKALRYTTQTDHHGTARLERRVGGGGGAIFLGGAQRAGLIEIEAAEAEIAGAGLERIAAYSTSIGRRGRVV